MSRPQKVENGVDSHERFNPFWTRIEVKSLLPYLSKGSESQNEILQFSYERNEYVLYHL